MKNHRSRWAWLAAGLTLAALLCLLASPAYGQADMPQRADQHVNDFANVIVPAERAALTSELGALLRDRGVELVVVTVGSPDDYGMKDQSFEAFATELFNRWGIGDRRRNDGVLLLVAVGDHKVRIEMGSGYGAAYDAAMQQVIARDIVPQFREQQYSAGIVAGVRGIQAALGGPPPSTAPAAGAPSVWRSPAAWLGAGVALVGVIGTAYTFWQSLRRPRRRCRKCRGLMRRLSDFDARGHLNKGQRAEQSLSAVTYRVWECRSCGSPEIERTLRYSSGLNECPSCHNHTLKSRVAGTTEQGKGKKRQRLQRIERSCQYCSYSDHRTETLAAAAASQFTASSSSYDSSSSSYDSSSTSSYDSSSSSYNSGGSSFDSGGSSSGDGASGSW
jgi:uncharacterized protein